MFTNETYEYVIDLNEDERDRWQEVIEHDGKTALKLAKEAASDFGETWSKFPTRMREFGANAFNALYAVAGGLYRGEMASWARAMNVSNGQVVMLNCIYEISSKCTAGIVSSEHHGMVHTRTLDWPLRQIGPATRIFRFVNGAHEFVIIGVVGHVGAFSGMVPGAYSVTINWAPPDGQSLDFGPSFLLRHVLETCSTYGQAVSMLRNTRLAAATFFTVCGAEPGQACVIERTREYGAVRKMRGGVLVQANHHVTREYQHRNGVFEGFEMSEERADCLERALTATKDSEDFDEISDCLDEEPVWNDHTRQQMVFVPATGGLHLWREQPLR